MLQRTDRKFVRLSAALLMAVAVTGGLLYGMNKVAVTLRMRDPTRYFKISNVIIPKPTGPVKRPAAAESQPATEQLPYGATKKPVLPVDRPTLAVPGPARPDVTPATALEHPGSDKDKSR